MRRALQWLCIAALACAVLATLPGCGERGTLTVGSKKFTESVILGEIVSAMARDAGRPVRHRRELGGSRVLFSALERGDIDMYPEYTGTLRAELLASEELGSDEELRTALSARGIEMIGPIGFNNTYALGMRRDDAARLDIARVSQLAAHPGLRFGLTNEFMNRADGWPGLRAAYGLPQRATGMDHDLAYQALAAGSIDVVDLYSTDADIAFYDLAVLEDDRGFFPRYDAVLLVRRAVLDGDPALAERLSQIAGLIDEPAMIAMNEAVKVGRESEAAVAAAFLGDSGDGNPVVEKDWVGERIWRRTIEHAGLVGTALLGAVLVSVPLGVFAARRPRLGQGILGVVGVLQTIPSLALLVVMIPLLGIGAWPAIVALFLYSLLPIVRNTHAGLVGIPTPLAESAAALGLSSWARLRLVELPLALPSILAGIKTAAVITVGTATLGALIGAGGYGQPILTGIRLASTPLILEGAVPAAVMALAVQGLFELIERVTVSPGLRGGPVR